MRRRVTGILPDPPASSVRDRDRHRMRLKSEIDKISAIAPKVTAVTPTKGGYPAVSPSFRMLSVATDAVPPGNLPASRVVGFSGALSKVRPDPAMNSPSFPQITGNVCAGIAVVLLLFPLRGVLEEYARLHLSDDRWVAPILYVLIPLWLLLMVEMFCVTARGGFDGLPLGRTSQHVLIALGTLSLGALSFVFIGLYMRPGFTPRALYSPVIYLVPLSTVLLGVLSLNPRLTGGMSIQWLRIPWVLGAGLCLTICAGLLGFQAIRTAGGAVAFLVQRIANPGPSSQEVVAQISALDPETQFEELLWKASHHSGRAICTAATARLRSHPKSLDRLCTELESGHVEPTLNFLLDAEFSPDELARLARPTRRALERWVDRIPAPNYTTRKHLRDLKNAGKGWIRGLSEKFAGTGVDFKPVMEDFQEKFEASR